MDIIHDIPSTEFQSNVNWRENIVPYSFEKHHKNMLEQNGMKLFF